MRLDSNYGNVTSESEFHRQVALLMTPGMIVLGLLMLVGLLGNLLVIYIYTVKLKRSPTNLFIIALGVFDVIVCSVCIPIEIVVMRFLYTFDRPWLCRVMRTIVIYCVLCSGNVLLAIAVDRYKRICKPFSQQITIKSAKIAICVGCVWSAVVAAPSMAILGSKSLNQTDFVGHACATDDSMISTPYPVLYNGLQFMIAMIAIVIYIVMYTFILRRVRAQDRYIQTIIQIKKRNETDMKSDDIGELDSEHVQHVNKNQSEANEADVTEQGFQEEVTDTSGKPSEKLQRGTYKTTFMMFLITAVFITGFIPHLALMATRAAQGHTFEHLKGAPLALYNLFLRIYFINSAANPIIYSFLSDKFRKEVKNILRRFCRK